MEAAMLLAECIKVRPKAALWVICARDTRSAYSSNNAFENKKIAKQICFAIRCFAGGDDGDRTHDLNIANVALSQLSYIPSEY